MTPTPDTTGLPSFSTLLRRSNTATTTSTTSTGGSSNSSSNLSITKSPLLSNHRLGSSDSSSPPSSPRTPRSSMEGPSPTFGPVGGMVNNGGMPNSENKRRPAPLTSLPSLSQLPQLNNSIPLTRKPSDERRNISALLNEPRRYDDYFSHQPQQSQQQVAPPPHHSPPYPQHQQHPHPDYHPQQHHLPPQQHQHHQHHQQEAMGMGVPSGPPSAPLMHADPRYYAPERYDYRPPTAPHPHPYARPDSGRRHTSYHPLDYPPYYDVPAPYPPGLVGMPFDASMGARAPISRTTKACDACRARKVRCDAGGHPGSTGTCSRCRESGRVCVYTATQKKRGPCPGRPASGRAVTSSGVPGSVRGAGAGPRRGSREMPRERHTWPSAGPSSQQGGQAPSSAPIHPQEWQYPSSGYPATSPYEGDPRHHPYHRMSPGPVPHTAPIDRDRAPPSAGWDAEPRHTPTFDPSYSLRPHPAAGWPNHRRQSYAYAPEYRRSVSPPPVRLAPLRRD